MCLRRATCARDARAHREPGGPSGCAGPSSTYGGTSELTTLHACSQRCLQVRSIACTIASLHTRPQRCMQGSSRSGRYGDGRTRGRGGTCGSETCDSSSPRNVSLRSTATEGDESAECAGASSSARAASAAGGPPRARRSLCAPASRLSPSPPPPPPYCCPFPCPYCTGERYNACCND